MTQVPNTLFAVELPDPMTHAFVTEAGEVLPFTASFDETLGGVRTGMLGQSDLPGSWFPEAGLRSRIPGTKTITAYIVQRANAQRDADRLVRLLPEVRELWLPSGDVLGLEYADLEARPRTDRLELVLFPTGPHPQQPFLDLGTLNLALPTESSTDERPLYGFDPAGSIRAPLRAKRVTKGSLEVSAYLTGQGVQPLASVGTPVAPDGGGVAAAVSLSVQGDKVVGLVGGVRVEASLEPVKNTDALFVALGVPTTISRYLSAALTWRGTSARLTVQSSLGVGRARATLPTPLPNLGEQVLTAGVRSDGLAVSGYLSEPVFTHRYLDGHEAEARVSQGYADVTEPDLSWAIMPPEMSLEVTRLDATPLELAPGSSLTFDLNVQRVGGHTGALNATATITTGLSVAVVRVSGTADTDLYRVTVTAPADAVEAAYTLSVEIAAAGADTPGSVLADVRDSYSSVVEVAAGPAIMPNATAVRLAYDPIQRRAAEMLRDSSGNGNTFSWAGYARPDRSYMGILATGRYGAGVVSDGLANAAQAHRMVGNQTFCQIWGEVAKTPVDGVMFQAAAVGSEDGVHLVRAEGGFKLRTVQGATTVLSPDTLVYSGGHSHLLLNIGTTEIALRDRITGQSIRLNRPAWADAAVRTTVGALRNAVGTLSSVTRAHLLADTMHPYSLSPLQERRNMDALLPYVPAEDGLEWPDSAAVIATWDDELSKYKNEAAPALGIQITPVGTVSSIPGGVYPSGGGYVKISTAIPSSGPVTAITSIQDFAGSFVTDYFTHLGFNDSVVSTGTAMLARNGASPFALITQSDSSNVYATIGYKPGVGNSLYLARFSGVSKSLEVTSLDSGLKKVVKSTNSYTGTVNVTLGALLRANGSVDRRTATKNMGLIICRGDPTADEIADTQELLAA